MPWYSNRKTYYQLGKSLVSFFREPIRYLKTSVSIESELEKPYLEDSYNDLQFSWLLPTWEWNWPGFGGGRPQSCMQSDYEYCQVQAFVTVDPEIHNVALQGGWGNMDFGATLRCGKGAAGCGLLGDELAPFGQSPSNHPKGWVKHESSDTCAEDFDVEYLFSWSEGSICGGGALPRICKGKFRVFCDVCSEADPLAYVSPVEATAGSAVTVTVSGGAGTWTWSVPSGNATFDSAETVTNTNGLTIDADACPRVTVLVQSCSETITEDIRVTDTGEWCIKAGDTDCHGASGLGTFVSGKTWQWYGVQWRILETYQVNGYGGGTCDGSICPGYPPIDCDDLCDSGTNCDTGYGCRLCLDLNDAKRNVMLGATCNTWFDLCCQMNPVGCAASCICVNAVTVYEWYCSGDCP